MTLVFLLEEASMAAFLEGLLPRLLPEGVDFRLIPHEGKSDLEKSIPRKLRGWRTLNTHTHTHTRFVIVRDQDAADCRAIKARLVSLCAEAGHPNTLVRIACRELEAWLLGDLAAVGQALDKPELATRQNEKKFRQPDSLGNPSQELDLLAPGHGKIGRARAVGPVIDLEGGRSTSFQQFVRGVLRVASDPGPQPTTSATLS